MQSLSHLLTVAVVAAAITPGGQAQLIANLRNFVNNIPSFYSTNNNPSFAVQNGRVNVNVPVPQNVQFGTVDPQTGTWELTDKSLGAGVAVGPNGAQILTAKPSTGDTQFTQAAALGPNGLTLGPNKVQEAASEQQRVAQGNLGIQNVKIGKDGLIINDGSRLNSSVQVDPQGIQLNGNPTGGGESHLYIKPNFNMLGQQFGQAAPPKEPQNIQVSYGNGKTTATEQLQACSIGYTNYALDPKKGTYAQVPNQAPPFMGVKPAGNPTPQYTSYAAQAPASYGAADSAASQTPVWQQETTPSGGPSSGYAAQAPVQRLQVVQKSNPRRFEYAGDIAAGSPQSAIAYARQMGGTVQQAQQQTDERQRLFKELQAELDARNAAEAAAARVPVAVPTPVPAYQDRSFQKLSGIADTRGAPAEASSADLGSAGVTSYAQEEDPIPDWVVLPSSGAAPAYGPVVAVQPEGYAPGPAEEWDMDLESFLLKKKRRRRHKKGVSPSPTPTPRRKHKKDPTSAGEAVAVTGQAHALDSEDVAASPGVTPTEVTNAAKQAAIAEGSGRPTGAVPAPLYAGGPPPSMMTMPVPPSTSSPDTNPKDPTAYVHSMLDDKSAEVIGENFLAVSPTAGVPEPDFVDMPAPAQAAALLATFSQAPAPAPVQKPVASELSAPVPSRATAPAPAPVQAPMPAPKQAAAAHAPAPTEAAALATKAPTEGPTPALEPTAAWAPAQDKQERFLEALAIIQAQDAALEHATAPAPAMGRKLLGM